MFRYHVGKRRPQLVHHASRQPKPKLLALARVDPNQDTVLFLAVVDRKLVNIHVDIVGKS